MLGSDRGRMAYAGSPYARVAAAGSRSTAFGGRLTCGSATDHPAR
jgi:hypothetical protein